MPSNWARGGTAGFVRRGRRSQVSDATYAQLCTPACSSLTAAISQMIDLLHLPGISVTQQTTCGDRSPCRPQIAGRRATLRDCRHAVAPCDFFSPQPPMQALYKPECHALGDISTELVGHQLCAGGSFKQTLARSKQRGSYQILTQGLIPDLRYSSKANPQVCHSSRTHSSSVSVFCTEDCRRA